MADEVADEEGRPLQEGEIPQIPEVKYEYLDHTADVQLHSWGDDLKESFEQVAMAMFNYMTTDITRVDMTRVHRVEAEGEDMLSLLYHFLDEFLFLFCAEPFLICRVVKILEFDQENFRIKAEGYGEEFDISKHPQGTEVKAITYSNMQVHEEEKKHDVFVIIDI
ncbi:protein archease-like [Littorina saxatilis]|uniref:Archease domain-containing protein n=1 Tax=Littorina saxatilis TaxID=31220 RepID=A0AAN9G268_9CAEN